MAKEKAAKVDPQELLKHIEKHSEYIVIGFLVLVIVVMLIFMGRKPSLEIPQPKPEDISKIQYPTEAAKDIQNAVNQQGSIEQTPYQKDLIDRNLFAPENAQGS
jgi:hypothetical protein